jgi:hypothetical protein
LVFSEKKEGIKERYELPPPFVKTVEKLYEILKKGGGKKLERRKDTISNFPIYRKDSERVFGCVEKI